MSWTISVDDIDDIARGSAVLGTGGGGDPYIGGLLAKQALREHGDVTVISLDELPDDAVVANVSMLGAPTVMVEKLPSLDSVIWPVQELSEHYGKPVTHLMCIEVGGVNSTIPIAAAAALGVPLVDGDGMGRAFPELQMVLPTLYGVSASPLAYADEKGNIGVLRTINNLWGERIIRVAAIEMGCSIMLSGFHMTGELTRKALVKDSLSLCANVGRSIVAARAEKVDAVSRVVEVLGGRELFGIGDARDGASVGRHDDGTNDDGARQGAPSDLIHPGDQPGAGLAQRTLEGAPPAGQAGYACGSPVAGTCTRAFFSAMRAALPVTSRR